MASKLKLWCEENATSVRSLDSEVGGGGQVAKFCAGSRDQLPLPLAAGLAEVTGLPLSDLLNGEQLATAQKIFAVMARDVSTRGR